MELVTQGDCEHSWCRIGPYTLLARLTDHVKMIFLLVLKGELDFVAQMDLKILQKYK